MIEMTQCHFYALKIKYMNIVESKGKVKSGPGLVYFHHWL